MSKVTYYPDGCITQYYDGVTGVMSDNCVVSKNPYQALNLPIIA